jgi:segregation and condensation protein A
VKDYRVELDVYNGPLDLLLFLIRRDEVEIHDIPIARITEQYVAYVQMIEQFDPNAAGDFLVMAATLMEIKSRMLLPRPPAIEEEEEDFGDPRLELVRQLLEYKKFKDAANQLGVAAEVQALKHTRTPPKIESDGREVELEEVEVWDLFDAFQRLLEQTGRRERTHDVVYDDTPLALHATDILDSLERSGGCQRFEEVFAGRSRSQIIGLFLALLELIRKKRVRATQDRPFGTITIHLIDSSPIIEDFDAAFETESSEPEELVPTADDSPESELVEAWETDDVGEVADGLGFPAESDPAFADEPEEDRVSRTGPVPALDESAPAAAPKSDSVPGVSVSDALQTDR